MKEGKMERGEGGRMEGEVVCADGRAGEEMLGRVESGTQEVAG